MVKTRHIIVMGYSWLSCFTNSRFYPRSTGVMPFWRFLTTWLIVRPSAPTQQCVLLFGWFALHFQHLICSFEKFSLPYCQHRVVDFASPTSIGWTLFSPQHFEHHFCVELGSVFALFCCYYLAPWLRLSLLSPTCPVFGMHYTR